LCKEGQKNEALSPVETKERVLKKTVTPAKQSIPEEYILDIIDKKKSFATSTREGLGGQEGGKKPITSS